MANINEKNGAQSLNTTGYTKNAWQSFDSQANPSIDYSQANRSEV
jgi:hypothetical protein